MIPRYEVKEVSAIWNDDNKFKNFLKVELALLEVLEELTIIPKGTTSAFKNVTINSDRINEIEQVTRHDLIAFTQSITEQVPPEYSRYFHFGVTSSDIIDTAQSLMLKESMKLVSIELDHLISQLQKNVADTSDLLAMGRSHGMNAEPLIFAQKFLSFQREFERRKKDYSDCMLSELTGQISGAVGNYTVLNPEIENAVVSKLGLTVETVSTQIIPRDHIAKILAQGALLAAAIERCSTEIRLLHHSDIAEVSEGFKAGQKGSSTMPHKKNPISTENLTGLSRIIKSHFEIALQNCNLWHERDISHSSSERLMLPDHFGLLVYSLKRLTQTLSNLEIHKEKITLKVKNNFTSLSSFILHQLILLNPKTATREEIYALVQKASFKAQNEEEFFAIIEHEAVQLKMTPPAKMTLQTLKNHYQSNFKKILTR